MYYIIAIVAYWLLFFHKIIANPYIIASSEALTYDFPCMIHSGKYWRKGKLPQDPYHFKDYLGVVIGQLYPLNILYSYITTYISLNAAWILQVSNLLLHNLATAILAYYLFGQGLIGLFGALVWGFAGYHIKQNLWYVQGFTWITATILAMEYQSGIMVGICLGMLYLCANPRFSIYFTYCCLGFALVRWWFPLEAIPIVLAISGYHIYRQWRYSRGSVTASRTYKNKVAIGKVPLWYYFTMFIPTGYQDYIDGVGYQEMAYYITPIAGFFMLFGRGHCWILLAVAILLSTGKQLFKTFNKLMMRFPQVWGYFAMLGAIVLAVDGLRRFELGQIQLSLIVLATAILLLHNSKLLPLYPFAQWTRKPSEFFDTPLLKFLGSQPYRVNNLPYPVYRGNANNIMTCGYTGGNHLKSLGKFLNLPIDGIGQYNWFDWKEDGKELDNYRIKYHIGQQPKDSKWVKHDKFDLWVNTKI